MLMEKKTYPGVKVVHMAWYLSPRSCKPFCSVPRAGVGPSSLPRRRLARCSTVRRWFDRPETAMRLQRSREKAQASDHTRNNNEMWPGKGGKSILLNLHGPWRLVHRHLTHDVRTAILGDNFKRRSTEHIIDENSIVYQYKIKSKKCYVHKL